MWHLKFITWTYTIIELLNFCFYYLWTIDLILCHQLHGKIPYIHRHISLEFVQDHKKELYRGKLWMLYTLWPNSNQQTVVPWNVFTVSDGSDFKSKSKIKETNKTFLFLKKKKKTYRPGCRRNLLLLTCGLY